MEHAPERGEDRAGAADGLDRQGEPAHPPSPGPHRSRPPPSRSTRWKFLTWCADSDIPEVRQLATTVDRWWPEIAAFIDTGHSNAKSEGINHVIKLVARNAFGCRNPSNQRLRTRCVTTRRARRHLRTAQL
ncbi:transposase [Streptomyces pristinaespiralis]|uniref:transposase n=1 Tax=Streptomyces pristinaespiralis TaxID=38300 RepID=UPI0037BAA679